MSEFLKILSSCDASSLAQVEKAMAELKASGISLPAEESLMDFRAGQLRGAELLANRTGSSDDLAKIGSVRKQFEGWAQSDPQAAAAWLDRLPNGKYRDQLAISYIGASAKDDPAGALHFVSSLRPSQQAEAGRMAAGRLMETGSVEDASAMLRTLESSGEKDDSAYLSAMFDTLARKAGGGDLAISLVESHLDRAYVNQAALNRVFALQAKEDPQRALGWALSMEGKKPGAQPGEMVWSAIKGMTVDGLKYAEDWAKSQPQADLWQQAIEKRKDLLEEHRGDENRYDKDD